MHTDLNSLAVFEWCLREFDAWLHSREREYSVEEKKKPNGMTHLLYIFILCAFEVIEIGCWCSSKQKGTKTLEKTNHYIKKGRQTKRMYLLCVSIYYAIIYNDHYIKS